MNRPTQDELVELAADWVRRHGDNGAMNLALAADTELLESGLVDSLDLVALVAYLEELTGCEMDLLELDPEDFATLGGLCRCAVEACGKETSGV
jgi:acyl carrier protein